MLSRFRLLSFALATIPLLAVSGCSGSNPLTEPSGFGGGSTSQKGKPGPSNNTTIPTEATFNVGSGIGGDERGGTYRDGTDGVKSFRVLGSSTTNGWAFDLAAKRTNSPRSLVYDLTQPDLVLGGTDREVLEVHDTHGQIYNLSTIPDGGTAYVRAAFHLIVDRVEYVLRFGQTPGDGSSALKVTRTGNSYWVRTDPNSGDIARFLQGNGPGETVLGYYHVPLDLTLTDQVQ